MYRPVLVAAPAIRPVSLTVAKQHLDVTYDDKDALIEALIAGATSHLDGWTGILGRCLVEQTWRQDFDAFCRLMRLPLFPIQSIVSVKYDDVDAVEQTVDAEFYDLLSDDLGYFLQWKDTFARPSTKSQGPSVRITYKAGYAVTGDAPNQVAAVPDEIRIAILMLVRHWFDNPSAVVVGVPAQKMPLAVDRLIAPFRRVSL